MIKILPNTKINESDILKDILLSQKFMTQSYNNFINEFSTANVKDEFFNILSDEHSMRIDILKEMENRKIFTASVADQDSIKSIEKRCKKK